MGGFHHYAIMLHTCGPACDDLYLLHSTANEVNADPAIIHVHITLYPILIMAKCGKKKLKFDAGDRTGRPETRLVLGVAIHTESTPHYIYITRYLPHANYDYNHHAPACEVVDPLMISTVLPATDVIPLHPQPHP